MQTMLLADDKIFLMASGGLAEDEAGANKEGEELSQQREATPVKVEGINSTLVQAVPQSSRVSQCTGVRYSILTVSVEIH